MFETEVLLLTEELYDYRDYVVDNILALDNGALSQLVNVGNYTEALFSLVLICRRPTWDMAAVTA